jgi:hypothetical protein
MDAPQARKREANSDDYGWIRPTKRRREEGGTYGDREVLWCSVGARQARCQTVTSQWRYVAPRCVTFAPNDGCVDVGLNDSGVAEPSWRGSGRGEGGSADAAATVMETFT